MNIKEKLPKWLLIVFTIILAIAGLLVYLRNQELISQIDVLIMEGGY